MNYSYIQNSQHHQPYYSPAHKPPNFQPSPQFVQPNNSPYAHNMTVQKRASTPILAKIAHVFSALFLVVEAPATLFGIAVGAGLSYICNEKGKMFSLTKAFTKGLEDHKETYSLGLLIASLASPFAVGFFLGDYLRAGALRDP